MKKTYKANALLTGNEIQGEYHIIKEKDGKEYHTIYDGKKHIIINLMTLQEVGDDEIKF